MPKRIFTGRVKSDKMDKTRVVQIARLVRHPKFGKIWGAIGILAGAAALGLNLQTFPFPPGEAGSVDLGPVVALWMLAVFIRFLLIKEP